MGVPPGNRRVLAVSHASASRYVAEMREKEVDQCIN